MGSQFAIVFDIVTVAAIVLMFFSGWRRGFVNVILGLVAAIVAFLAALFLSTPLAETVYTSVVEKPLTEKISEAVDESFSSFSLGSLSDLDYTRVIISGNIASEIKPDYSGRDSAVVDLSNVDFSKIGFTENDLAFLGLESDYDLGSVNIRNVEFSKNEIEKYGLGQLAVSQFVAVKLIEKGELNDFNTFWNIVNDYIPVGENATITESITVSYARKFVLGMLDTRTSLSETVMQNFVRPSCILVFRSIAFVIIFALVLLVLKLIASVSGIIKKIPVIGDVNSLLGGMAGAVEGVLIVFAICLLTRLAVCLLDGNVIMFNDETIANTYIFKRIYNFDFLNFLT